MLFAFVVYRNWGSGAFGDNVKPRYVGYNYDDIRAHIITIILCMFGLGEVIKGIYEPTRLGRVISMLR